MACSHGSCYSSHQSIVGDRGYFLVANTYLRFIPHGFYFGGSPIIALAPSF